MKKSLDEIEAGDKVYYTSRYYSKILKVDRVTSTTIICGTEKFRKQMVVRYRQIHGVVVTFQYLLKVWKSNILK